MDDVVVISRAVRPGIRKTTFFLSCMCQQVGGDGEGRSSVTQWCFPRPLAEKKHAQDDEAELGPEAPARAGLSWGAEFVAITAQ